MNIAPVPTVLVYIRSFNYQATEAFNEPVDPHKHPLTPEKLDMAAHRHPRQLRIPRS